MSFPASPRATGDRKLFAGGRVRRFRMGLGLTQAQMAAELGLSASYLNLIERDQRPLSAQVLLKLVEAYDLDLRAFAAEADERVRTGLAAAAGDPVLADLRLDAGELTELLERAPRAAEAIARLHVAYRQARDDAADAGERLRAAGAPVGEDEPFEQVCQAFDAAGRHLPDLEAAAETLRASIECEDGEAFGALRRRLRSRHDLAVRVVPYEAVGALRWHDRHGRAVLLSETLGPSSRTFQLAMQLALLEEGERLDRAAEEGGFSTVEARRLYRLGCAGYLAAAIVMPYGPFLEAARARGFHPEALSRRFGASFEQVCHRLTTLRRRGAEGPRFFLLRADAAGNVSKRVGASGIEGLGTGALCARWRIQDAFRQPGEDVVQHIALGAGAGFVTLARAVERVSAEPGAARVYYVLALGCRTEEAGPLAWGGIAAEPATPIGPGCRRCERPDCRERAHPPLLRRLWVDEHRKGAAPFAFRAD